MKTLLIIILALLDIAFAYALLSARADVAFYKDLAQRKDAIIHRYEAMADSGDLGPR